MLLGKLARGVFFAGGLLVFVSCYVTPRPVYRLQPVSGDLRWYHGTEVVREEADSVELAVAFLRQEGEELTFEVEVANYSTRQILVAPEKFYYRAVVARRDAPAKSSQTDDAGRGAETEYIEPEKSFAIDPEKRLLAIDLQNSRENAGYASAVATDAAFTMLDLFVDIATLGKEKSDSEIAREEQADVQDQIDRVNRDNQYEYEQRRIMSEREKWEYEVLRKTHLNPGESVTGTVYFYAHQNAKAIQLHFPVDSSEVKFVFRQTVFRP